MYGTHYSSHTLITVLFSRLDFEKYSNLKKTCPVGVKVFHADKQATMTKISHFLKFYEHA